MTETVLLVDYENVQTVDLSRLPDNARVVLVLGPKQKNVSVELAMQAQPLGDRFVYVPIKSQQPNGVDFCVAFYLGTHVTESPESEYVILSRDKKGFDPLVEHLSAQPGLRVRRVDSQAAAFPALFPSSPKPAAKTKAEIKARANGTSAPEADFERAVELLKKDKARPRKKTSLESKLKSWFPEKSGKSIKAVVNRLINERYVCEVENTLAYPKLDDLT